MWRISSSHIHQVQKLGGGILRRRRSSLAVLMLCCRPTVVTPWMTNIQLPKPCSSGLLPSSQRRYVSNSNHQEESSSLNDSLTNHLPRIYIDTPKLVAQSLVTLTPFQANYLNVMRLSSVKRWGQWAGHLRVFNGCDGEWLAKLVLMESSGSKKRRRGNIQMDTAMIECLEVLKEQPPASTNTVQLHMGRLKKPRRKWMLEKVTELGISHIHAIDTEFAALTDPWEYDKHLAQVIEAAEQCERFTLPYLSQTPNTWEELLTTIQETSASSEDSHQWLVCRERSPTSRPILQTLQDIQNDGDPHIHVLVGPEGGWSPQEIDRFTELTETQNNFRFVSLGQLVLRAETAAISAVAAVMMSQDDCNPSAT